MGSGKRQKANLQSSHRGTWYKIFSGVSQDTKLAVVARRSGFRRGEVLAVWLALLDRASTAKPRGCVNNIDAEEIAATLECDTAAIASVIDTLRERKLISPDGMIAEWNRYQDHSTPRTRAYRQRKAAALQVSA
jgi:hypothetical protein